MAYSEDIRLQRMGLIQLPVCDENEVVGEEDFITRANLYGKLKDSALTDNKPLLETKLPLKPPNILVIDNVFPATYQSQ